jgi:hypothetical protein
MMFPFGACVAPRSFSLSFSLVCKHLSVHTKKSIKRYAGREFLYCFAKKKEIRSTPLFARNKKVRSNTGQVIHIAILKDIQIFYINILSLKISIAL